jgi:hypothetical protein
MLMDKALDIIFPRFARSALNKFFPMKELIGWGTFSFPQRLRAAMWLLCKIQLETNKICLKQSREAYQTKWA